MKSSLRRRILAGYGVAVALTVVVLGWGLVNLLRLGQAAGAILRENYRSILAAERMLDALAGHENAILQTALDPGVDTSSARARAEGEFRMYLDQAKGNITLPGEGELLEGIEREYGAYLKEAAAFLRTEHGGPKGALADYRTKLLPRLSAVRQSCKGLRHLNQVAMEAGSRRAHVVAQTAFWSMLVVGVGAIAAGIGFSLLLSTRIARPVRRLKEATQQVAAGDYGVHLATGSQDELGALAENFNLMVTKLRAFHELNVRKIVAEKTKSEAILRSIDDGVFVVDARHQVTSMNPAAARALGASPGDLGQRPLADLVHDDRLRRAIEQALACGGPAPGTAKHENYLSVQDGPRELHFEYSITPVQTDTEETLAVVVLLRNVTKLKEFDRLKSEFVMTASHELRTPLTSIGMSIELLRERAGQLAEDDRRLLEVAHEELVRLTTLVNELLDLTRIETGKMELHFAEVAIRPLLENAVLPFRSQAEEKSVALALEVPDGLPPIWADAGRMAQVVTNLVGNAVRHTPAGGHVWVSSESAGARVHLYVRDDGPGIPHEYQAAIFGKFVQLKDTAEHGGGTGLGLAIAKEIVRAHHGGIWVESEPGHGALFTVALPARHREPQGEPS